MATLLILYGHLNDPAAFEDYYTQRHLPWAAETMPGVRGAALRRIVGAPGDRTAPYYRTAEMTWRDLNSLHAALASPDGRTVLADIENFATGGAVLLVGEEDHPQ